ncbi:MAG: isoaspartyl peptidase/L-asparaginase [Bacteroidetes bacterium]|nr:isoaspartyl peptidase/L-asparaginase [Bacteroidota bacterium]
MNKLIKPGIAIHGGAGTILKAEMSVEMETQYQKALEDCLSAGYKIIEKNGSSLDAVEAAVEALENCPLFNAGKGAVFTHEGKHEMDASIVDGRDINAGAVSGIRNVKNPIRLARAVMEQSEFVMLYGNGAEEFAKSIGAAFEADEYFFNEFRWKQLQQIRHEQKMALDHSKEKKMGTVGAVALDVHGNLAAATSTGGMTNKRYNRIGDTPIVGAGTYANNNTCAISCTGHGEYFIRAVVAYDISCLMEYANMSLEDACRKVVVAIDSKGNICLPFNSEGMYRAQQSLNEKISVGIYK